MMNIDIKGLIEEYTIKLVHTNDLEEQINEIKKSEAEAFEQWCYTNLKGTAGDTSTVHTKLKEYRDQRVRVEGHNERMAKFNTWVQLLNSLLTKLQLMNNEQAGRSLAHLKK